MDPITAMAASGAAGLVGTVLTNQANAQQVSNQDNFQANMSNTSYQRQVADMKAAGLNPMFAMGSGGASTPSGSVAQMQNPISAGLSAAQQATQVGNSLKDQFNKNSANEASIRNTDANTLKTAAETAALKGDSTKGGIISDALSTLVKPVKDAASWLNSPSLYNGFKGLGNSINGWMQTTPKRTTPNNSISIPPLN